ncbi:head-tail adaptor protein [Aeromonas jandaei]|uniref:head-tail adaptor protein n=1 Tax=Aeromonas jandaei TaxID=650 RepID=UPI003BA1C502
MKIRQSSVVNAMRPPSAGELKQRLQIRLVTEVPDDNFSTRPEYHDQITVWGKLMPVTGGIYMAGVQIDEKVTHKCLIRWRQLTGDHQMVHKGTVYRVKRCEPLNGETVWALVELEQLDLPT